MNERQIHRHNFTADGYSETGLVVMNCSCGLQAHVRRDDYFAEGEAIKATLNAMGSLPCHPADWPRLKISNLISR